MKKSNDIEVDLLKQFKDAYLSLKQGEALERISTPRTHDEAISLGNFGHQAAYSISCVDLHQNMIKLLTGYDGNELTKFTETVSRASGSIGFARAKLTLEAISNIGQYVSFPKGQIPTPTVLQAPPKG